MVRHEAKHDFPDKGHEKLSVQTTTLHFKNRLKLEGGYDLMSVKFCVNNIAVGMALQGE